jgi:hypothetical protein
MVLSSIQFSYGSHHPAKIGIDEIVCFYKSDWNHLSKKEEFDALDGPAVGGLDILSCGGLMAAGDLRQRLLRLSQPD